MLLYHGSNMAIEEIDLAKSRPYKDFGKAFYLFADKKQAKEMAKFKVLTSGGEVCITAFEFDEHDINMLKVKRFENYTEEWAEFVYNNRDEKQAFVHVFDLVYGTIANDTVGVQIRDLRERKISFEMFLKNLEYYKGITFQYAFCTPLAVSKLKIV
ncbi:DUF3990 domain-containing protein [Bacteroides heparinolyticus]|uniref:DUF3990 domain-containing protein n=1 Tax=Prevotella heparinolytica TaxID=28113 RepID=UPI00359F7C01